MATASAPDTIPVGSAPHSIAIRPDGSRAYVSNSGAGTLSVIDTAAGVVTATIGVGTGPWAVTVTPDGQFVCVTEPGSGTVGFVSTATGALIGTVSGLTVPRGLAVTPDGTRLYVANSGTNTVSVINTATRAITGTVTVGNSPETIAIRPDGLRAYVSHPADGTVRVINTLSATVTATVTGFDVPLGVAVAPDGARLYVANSGGTAVSIVSTTDNSVIGTITVATSPAYLAVSPDGTLLYATMTDADSLTVINPSSNTVTHTLSGFATPHEVTTTPDGGYLYVANYGDDTVGVLRRPAAITPDQGPPSGGMTVTITGRGFLGTTSVLFGQRPAKSFTVLSDTVLTAVTPSLSRTGAKAAPVTVTSSGGTAIIGHYYYQLLPVIDEISLSSGPMTGGNVLTLTGRRLTGVKYVRFGTLMAPATVLSDTRITVAVPPSVLARSVPVYVTNKGGVSNSLSYTYVSTAAITSISPASGPSAGSRVVNINGTSLSQVNSVTFGGVPALSFKVMSAIKVQSITPPHAPGPVAVVVTTSTGATATAPHSYTYI